MLLKTKQVDTYVVSVLIALAVGALGAVATAIGMPAYRDLVKPPLTPPSVLFPIVWTVLYILMGISAARIGTSCAPEKRRALWLYGAQLIVNGLWSVWFFALGARLFAFAWLLLLWGLLVAMIRAFDQIDRKAALLQIPYLLWVTFAGYLNLSIWLLNRG